MCFLVTDTQDWKIIQRKKKWELYLWLFPSFLLSKFMSLIFAHLFRRTFVINRLSRSCVLNWRPKFSSFLFNDFYFIIYFIGLRSYGSSVWEIDIKLEKEMINSEISLTHHIVLTRKKMWFLTSKETILNCTPSWITVRVYNRFSAYFSRTSKAQTLQRNGVVYNATSMLSPRNMHVCSVRSLWRAICTFEQKKKK